MKMNLPVRNKASACFVTFSKLSRDKNNTLDPWPRSLKSSLDSLGEDSAMISVCIFLLASLLLIYVVTSLENGFVVNITSFFMPPDPDLILSVDILMACTVCLEP